MPWDLTTVCLLTMCPIVVPSPSDSLGLYVLGRLPGNGGWFHPSCDMLDISGSSLSLFCVGASGVAHAPFSAELEETPAPAVSFG